MGSVFTPLLGGAVSSHLCVLSVTPEHLFVAHRFYPQHTYVVWGNIILIFQTGGSGLDKPSAAQKVVLGSCTATFGLGSTPAPSPGDLRPLTCSSAATGTHQHKFTLPAVTGWLGIIHKGAFQNLLFSKFSHITLKEMELIAIVNVFLMWQKAKCSQYITFPFLLTHSSVPLRGRRKTGEAA